MEDDAPMNFGELNNSICQECGLPLKLYSFEKINPETDSEEIKIKLYCQNIKHKKIHDIDFEKFQEVINENLDEICKCVLCNKILQNPSDIPYYCYTCMKIICSDCLDKKHEKEHQKVFKYKELKNKCLIHFKDRNEINFYCVTCKINMCANCIMDDLKHYKNHGVEDIQKIKEMDKKSDIILDINREQFINRSKKKSLMEKLKKLDAKINFNDYILKLGNSNCFHLFAESNNYNNYEINKTVVNKPKINLEMKKKNKSQNINMIDDKIDNNEEKKVENKKDNVVVNKDSSINVIYHDENIKFDGMDIINDCNHLQKETNGSIILCNDVVNLEIILNNCLKNNIKSKFVLIINGSSAENVIHFIKKNNYTSLFIGASIYTAKLNKYSKIKDKYPDFIQKICIDCQSLAIFIKECFEKIKVENEKFYIDTLINSIKYKECYFALHKELSKFYGDETKEAFSLNYQIIEDYIKNENYPNEVKNDLLKSFSTFSELSNKNYERILISYIKSDNFSQVLNSLLKAKDLLIYKKIGYFAGNLMHSLVEYGSKNKKGINKGAVFYKGVQLPIIDLLEFLKNRGLRITFTKFITLTNRKEFAQIMSKRNLSDKERKKKELYSVIMKIDYLYDDGYEPCVFDLKELAQYPDEEEYILLPFTFLILKKIAIDSNQFTADMELSIIGKKEILENKIKESHNIYFDKENNIMGVIN